MWNIILSSLPLVLMTLNLFLIEVATENLLKLECSLFLLSVKVEHRVHKGGTLSVHPDSIFWTRWCSESHWRLFHLFGLSAFICECKLSTNNKLDRLNISFLPNDTCKKGNKEWQSLRMSLMVQWLRLHFPMQGMQVQSMVGELGFHMPRGQNTRT